jgi:hypothetical protein
MENKPTNQVEVQINEEELDEVVGGQDVIGLQSYRAPVEDNDCLSWQSCVSHVST